MSDWNRSGREEDQRRDRTEDRNRRDFGRQDPWANQRPPEQRSFTGGEQRHWDEERRGYGAEGYGPEGYGAPRYGGQERRDQGQDTRRYGAERYGSESERSGGQMGRDYERREAQMYGRQEHRGEPQRYGQGGGLMGGNQRLERISDGEGDQGMRANMGMGEHRGRGPKNYTRSDERIREDVNDRLSDDAWLDASEIEVQVAKCEVTLTGSVQTRDDKRRAEDVVERISGVKHVQNNLRVQQNSGQPMSGQSALGAARSTLT